MTPLSTWRAEVREQDRREREAQAALARLDDYFLSPDWYALRGIRAPRSEA